MSSTPESILAQLQAAGSEYAEKTPGAREKLLNLGYALVSSLELPSEAIQRMGWAEPARAANCRVAVELKIFDILKESGEQGASARDLAASTGADEILISRTLKHLAAMNVVAESGADKYVGTRLSNEPRFRDGIIYTYDVAGPSFRGLPEYLKSIDYALPTKLTDGPFQAAHKTQLPFFAWLDQNPPYLQAFNNYMAAYRAGKPSWVDPGFYPISERLVDGFDTSSDSDNVLLVDVGGGMGHDLKELKEKHPSLPGKLILQDRPEVVSGVSGGDVFEATAHDFFTPQPVKDAQAYYLHSVLHDWGDEDCIRILQQLQPVMKPGYSRLLINEIIVPDRNPTWPVTSMDQLVFVLGAMKERTEAYWNSILKQAGFKVVRIYNYEMASESLIEAELA
ncbi:putative O-methyltransferase [Hypoxylon sp. FL1857]|nr:putative O-methyltransferase [Hypoxylon sp. FL1857]